MKRTSRWSLARIGIATVLVLVVGVLAPSFSPGSPAVAATDGQMIYPASGNIQSKISDGCRGNYRKHDGIDITGAGGAPILAAYDGVITARTSNGGYGYYTDVTHPGGYHTRYGHMAAPGKFAVGTRVVRGQQIGVVGKTGATSAYHLHFEVRRNGAIYTPVNQGFTCLSNVTRGGFIPHFFPGLGSAPASQFASADFDADTKADLLVVAGNGDLRLRTGTGSGAFRAPKTAFSGWGNTRKHITHTDFNGDRKGDILVAVQGGALEFYAGTGGGTFRPAVKAGSGWYSMLHVASGADYSGDGRQDVLAVSSTGTLTIYRGNGSGGFGSSHRTVGVGWQGFHYLVGGDFDNDGRGDIIAVADTGALYFYPGNGDAFGKRREVGSGWQEFTSVSGGVDYDGDGRADLLARRANGDLFLYPGTGDGAFGGKRLVSSGWSDYLAIE
ncbi:MULTISPECIES: VCBS repeat domain-containing M23 family metallopeptidase [unclassified Microbacterium]|uniref:VCBS repeat domain-containing M23 family metallopeptidase n=1 Tax=unclassified Microbacterium TaxID=2609290 RepID=UPI000EA8413B|nr:MULTISPECIES: VCBS repeat domain-containing M23 family metallopeptidase [unclassified Microbacterium]MBT2484577.1 VCBS repeat domain-containing M23 family metallopeptidase [Microbacterium sp. ISL-108]RKN67471.1 hypothetical protein D7252_07690 [Microbacterium sp. CGR2]